MDHLIIFHIIVFYDDFEPISIHFSNDFDFFTSYFSYIYFTYFLSTFFFSFHYIFLYFSFLFLFSPSFSIFLPSIHFTPQKNRVCNKHYYFSKQQVVCVGVQNFFISQDSKLYVWAGSTF